MPLEESTVVRLLLRERDKILAYMRSLVVERAAAEDLFQDISALAVTRAAEIESESHLLGWLRRAARYKVMNENQLKHHQFMPLEEDALTLLDEQWREYDSVPSIDLIEGLERCMQRLTPNAQQLIRLKYFDGLDGNAIAQRLSRQVRSIYTALSRVHRVLGDCVRRERAAGEARHGN